MSLRTKIPRNKVNFRSSPNAIDSTNSSTHKSDFSPSCPTESALLKNALRNRISKLHKARRYLRRRRLRAVNEKPFSSVRFRNPLARNLEGCTLERAQLGSRLAATE